MRRSYRRCVNGLYRLSGFDFRDNSQSRGLAFSYEDCLGIKWWWSWSLGEFRSYQSGSSLLIEGMHVP